MDPELWKEAWTEEFTDHDKWLEAGEPNGFLWGTNWTNAYPGISAVENSELAELWSKRIEKPMYEAKLETDRFTLHLVFHSIVHRKISEDTGTISAVIIPLK